MSLENIKKFNEAVSTDEALMEEVKKVGTNLDELIALGKKKGYDFTAEELTELSQKKEGELSEEELDNVSGGAVVVETVVVGEVVVTSVVVEV